MGCPFCNLVEVLADSPLAVAVRDRFPVSRGHTLVLPRRHVATYPECSASEKAALWSLVDEVRIRLIEEFRPDGFNFGINIGEAAGQTVLHCHVHIIPRYTGDVPDPRGGVRHVIHGKGNYLLGDAG